MVFVSMSGVRNFKLASGAKRRPFSEIVELYRDVLQLPDFLIQSYDEDIESMIKQIFDILTNAFGLQNFVP